MDGCFVVEDAFDEGGGCLHLTHSNEYRSLEDLCGVALHVGGSRGECSKGLIYIPFRLSKSILKLQDEGEVVLGDTEVMGSAAALGLRESLELPA